MIPDAIIAEAARLEEEQVAAFDPYEGSPFAFMRNMPPARRGKVGERIANAWLRSENFVVGARRGGGDLQVNGHETEVKLSLLWDNGDVCFQQIRPNTWWKLGLLIAAVPQEVQIWIVPKDALLELARPQHASGEDTYWLRFPYRQPPSALGQYGGEPSWAADVLRQMESDLEQSQFFS